MFNIIQKLGQRFSNRGKAQGTQGKGMVYGKAQPTGEGAKAHEVGRTDANVTPAVGGAGERRAGKDNAKSVRLVGKAIPLAQKHLRTFGTFSPVGKGK